MRILRCVAIGVLATLSFRLTAVCQTTVNNEVGLVPFGSYDSGSIDYIDTKNGNLVLNIPLFSLPQRGRLALSYSLRANSTRYKIRVEPAPYTQGSLRYTYDTANDYVGPYPVWDQGFRLRVTGNIRFDLQEEGMDGSIITGLPGGAFSTYGIEDSSGAIHDLGFDSATNLTTLRSYDGTGFLFRPDTAGYIVNGGTLYTPDGLSRCMTEGGCLAADPDGNKITRTADTFGRAWSGGEITEPASSVCPNIPAAAHQPLRWSLTWRVPGPGGTTQTYTFCHADLPVHTNFLERNGQSFMQTILYDPIELHNPQQQYYWYEEAVRLERGSAWDIIQSVVLPNGTYWAFIYDAADPNDPNSIAYGDIKEVQFPTGGKITYTYDTVNICQRVPTPTIPTDGFRPDTLIPVRNRVVTSRTLDPLTPQASARYYSYPVYQIGNDNYDVQMTDTAGGKIVHHFTHLGTGEGWNPAIDGDVGCVYGETQQQYFQQQPNGTYKLLKTVNTDLNTITSPQMNARSVNTATGQIIYPPVALGVPKSETTVWPDGSTSTSTYEYDSGFMNVQPVLDYTNGLPGNWVIPSAPPLAMQMPMGLLTSTTATNFDGKAIKQESKYMWQQNNGYFAANFMNLPYTVTTSNGAGQQVAKTTYGYDEQQLQFQPGSIPNHDASTGLRGHQTSAQSWVKTTRGASSTETTVSTATQYYDTGMVYKLFDGKNVPVITYEYSSEYAGAYPTKMTSALGPYKTFTYDLNTGRTLIAVDENAVQTTFSYADPIGRLTATRRAANTPAETRTALTYNDGSRSINVQGDLHNTGDAALTTMVYFDGVGRKIQSCRLTGDGWVAIAQEYDGAGRVYRVSNPFKCATACTASAACLVPADAKWTTTEYDVLNRVTRVIKQDGGQVTTDYNGATVTVTDEAGKKRRTTTDALGRIVQVVENPSN